MSVGSEVDCFLASAVSLTPDLKVDVQCGDDVQVDAEQQHDQCVTSVGDEEEGCLLVHPLSSLTPDMQMHGVVMVMCRWTQSTSMTSA